MKKYVKIGGMNCGHCVSSIEHVLGQIEGISNIEVDLRKQTAVFDADTEVNNQEIIDMIESAGFEVKEIDWE
jgi:copper ion binding protein